MLKPSKRNIFIDRNLNVMAQFGYKLLSNALKLIKRDVMGSVYTKVVMSNSLNIFIFQFWNHFTSERWYSVTILALIYPKSSEVPFRQLSPQESQSLRTTVCVSAFSQCFQPSSFPEILKPVFTSSDPTEQAKYCFLGGQKHFSYVVASVRLVSFFQFVTLILILRF